MCRIYDCVDKYVALLDTKYYLIIGRKNIALELNLYFDKKDCYHLMGLQYIKDRPELHIDRGVVFDAILHRTLDVDQIESSDQYDKIKDRIRYLPYLEQIIDSNETIFKYNSKANNFSKIQADFLMCNYLYDQNLYVFLSENEEGKYFCKSFFPKTNRDYTIRQPKWTLLYKEKIMLSQNTKIILYNGFDNKEGGETGIIV